MMTANDFFTKQMRVQQLLADLCNEIEAAEGIDEKTDLLNFCRTQLHSVSPYKDHPVDCVIWEKTENVEVNNYNPNSVAPPELKLLIRSIIDDGYTMSIYTCPTETGDIIIDGFHRRLVEKLSTIVSKSTFGRIPITRARPDKRNINDRMASTIKHNRARGTHSIDLMVNIVAELTRAGMSDQWIMKHIGMDADEILRLKMLSGLDDLYKDNEFSNSDEK